jgi:hypothetical protein
MQLFHTQFGGMWYEDGSSYYIIVSSVEEAIIFHLLCRDVINWFHYLWATLGEGRSCFLGYWYAIETQWLTRLDFFIDRFGRSRIPPSIRLLLNDVEYQLGLRVTAFDDDIESLFDESDVSSTIIFADASSSDDDSDF